MFNREGNFNINDALSYHAEEVVENRVSGRDCNGGRQPYDAEVLAVDDGHNDSVFVY